MKQLLLRWLTALMLLSSMAPAMADQLLGAGDVLKVSVFNNPEMTVETRINDNGAISFPLVGQVQIGGLTTAMAEKKLAGMLAAGGYVKNPQVNLLVTVNVSQQVSLLGQVNRPGRYPLDTQRSVLELLALAGGVNPDGADSVVLVRKGPNGATVKEVIDVVEMVRSGDLRRDLVVQANDVIYVERAPRFYIYGEVQRPGTYRIERAMTVVQALSTGGGLTARGTERGVRIKRRGPDGRLQELDAKHEDLIQPDDVIYVKESLF